MMKQKGFTLIELLVVIAIIAILAAILFPVFIAARDKARQTACLNNQKQLGTAMMQYVDDWAGTYPTIVNSVHQTHDYGLFYPLSRYLKNMKVLKCPSAKEHKYKYYITNYVPRINYVVNGDGNWPDFPALWGFYRGRNYIDRPAKMAEIKYPSRVVAIQDWQYATNYGDVAFGFNSWYCFPVHSGGITLAMADGHAMWIKTEGVEFFQQIGDSEFTQPWKPTYGGGKISYDPYYSP